MKQKSFFSSKDFPPEFGGALLKNKRKSKRPLSTKKSTHLVLKSNSQKLLAHRKTIYSTFDSFAQRFNIRVYKKGLAPDHVHSLILFRHSDDYKSFIRAVTGVLSRALKIKWIVRPFTRVVEWGRAFKRAVAYVLQNELEGLGLLPYRQRARYKGPP